jgi:hypothetical protein
MPELAEVEYMRKQVFAACLCSRSHLNHVLQWNAGIDLTVTAVSIHENNVFKVAILHALVPFISAIYLFVSLVTLTLFANSFPAAA